MWHTWHSHVLSPQEHLTGSAVGVLLERVHLEVVLVGRGSLWLDVGAILITRRNFFL